MSVEIRAAVVVNHHFATQILQFLHGLENICLCPRDGGGGASHTILPSVFVIVVSVLAQHNLDEILCLTQSESQRILEHGYSPNLVILGNVSQRQVQAIGVADVESASLEGVLDSGGDIVPHIQRERDVTQQQQGVGDRKGQGDGVHCESL